MLSIEEVKILLEDENISDAEAERMRDVCGELAALGLKSWRCMRNNAATHHQPTTAYGDEKERQRPLG